MGLCQKGGVLEILTEVFSLIARKVLTCSGGNDKLVIRDPRVGVPSPHQVFLCRDNEPTERFDVRKIKYMRQTRERYRLIVYSVSVISMHRES